MGKIGYTFAMMRASWEVLKKDKELLLFPLLSGFCCLLVMLSFALSGSARFEFDLHRTGTERDH